MSGSARFLDHVIPLNNATHADVTEYLITIPMRYAICVAELADGRQVGLRDPRQLVGWSGPKEKRTILLRSGDCGIEIKVETDWRDPIRSVHLCQLALVNSATGEPWQCSKLITRDGSLLFARLSNRKNIAAGSRINRVNVSDARLYAAATTDISA